jgi:S-adenosylmethionine:tRNA ribosyltransferase-isomerase
VQVSDFHFDLPEELIAQYPLEDRSASRLLRVQKAESQSANTLEDLVFHDFPDLLCPDDLVVFNNTRVFPARLFGHRMRVEDAGGQEPEVEPRHPASAGNETLREVTVFGQGRVEVLLTKQISPDPSQPESNQWECLVRPSRKLGIGERIVFGVQGELQAEVVSRGSFGVRVMRFEPVKDFFAVLEQLGHVPLPPYIAREEALQDRERYQTVYAKARGSVAAPTAGLHFTAEILARLRDRGIETAEVTLHVGLGTFQPIRVDRVEDHRLHGEAYSISEDAANRINGARAAGRRVVAVGTTTVRTLEFAAMRAGGNRVEAGSGEANLFIYPGFRFRVVGAMLTNFHLPQSTLLMLVCAFGGTEKILAAYRHAVERRYRFYSYGDCMLVE